MSIKTGVATGAVLGAGVAIILLSLEQIRPFSPHANDAIDRLTFRLCPLYILGFANGIGMAVLVTITILGNAILYGVVFGILAALSALFQRKAAA
jgi:energy-converting hydrogenase Eha subunit G